MPIKTCIVCSISFASKTTAKTCSAVCWRVRDAQRSKTYRTNHREQVLERLSENRHANPQKYKDACRRWLQRNREEINAGRRKKYAADPEPKKAAVYAWRNANTKKVRSLARQRRVHKSIIIEAARAAGLAPSPRNARGKDGRMLPTGPGYRHDTIYSAMKQLNLINEG